MKSETIAAIATPLSNSGIGIVRISGERAVEIADRVYKSKNGKKVLADCKTHTIHYGYIYDDDELIDEVMVLIMKKPNSFTAEDTVEIDCHGGIFVMQRILQTVLKNGARLAEPGEFSKRAFLNGRIDLSKAEAIMDLIGSKNDYALKASVAQLRGSMFDKIKQLRSDIIFEIAFIESALDDPEHISLDGYCEKLSSVVDRLTMEIAKMISTYDNGKIIKEGINTAIVGKPNAGKSSLLNKLSGEDRAIVTDIAGTTRDVLEQSVSIDGISLNLLDTAGIRSTEDVVEKIGVDRAMKSLRDADLVLYVIDISTSLDESDKQIIKELIGKKVILILNKSDLNQVVSKADIEEICNFLGEDVSFIYTSMENESGLEELNEKIKEMFFHGTIENNDEITISNMRHKEALGNALSSLKLVKQSLMDEMPEDFYSIDLMSAYTSLGEIIGEEVNDDLVNEIFAKFCMGK